MSEINDLGFLERLFHDLNFIQGFMLGLIFGILLGVAAMVLFGRTGAKKEDLLAWTIVIIWLVWNVVAGFTGIIATPPSMFDIVSGGAVGFVLGEKFFDQASRIIKK